MPLSTYWPFKKKQIIRPLHRIRDATGEKSSGFSDIASAWLLFLQADQKIIRDKLW